MNETVKMALIMLIVVLVALVIFEKFLKAKVVSSFESSLDDTLE